MKIKTFIITLCCVALICVVPVFATDTGLNSSEGVEVNSEASETLATPTPQPTPIGLPHTVEIGNESINQIAMAVALVLETQHTKTLELEPDVETVNISDESVSAIAEAVAAAAYSYSYQYELITNDGKSIIIDTDESDLLNEYDIAIFYRKDFGTYWLTFNPNVYRASGYIAIDKSYTKQLYTNNVWSFSTVDTLSNKSYYSADQVIWSNYHIYDSKTGELIYESSYAPAVEFTISFVTGFSDLVIESQIHNNFVLPSPKYNGYIFKGWYLDSGFTQKYDGAAFTSDTTLYALWEEMPDNMKGVIIHQTIFESMTAFFTCEPILYILSLMGLVIIIAIGRRMIQARF